jgi:hypothetical protein
MAFIKGKQLASSTVTDRELADSAVTNAKLSGSISPSKLDLTADFTFSGAVNLLTAPTSATHAATKGYVDGVKQSLDIKDSVRVATKGDDLSASYANNVLTASANGAISVDDIALSAGDRILVKDQTTGSQNGIYVVTTVGDAGNPFVLTRAEDFNSDDDISSGAFCFVEEGTVNADYGFVLSTNESITLDTTSLTFTQFSGAGQITAGNGLSKDGATLAIDLDADSGLAVGANGLKIDASVLADGAISVANDEIVFIDADGGTKRESVADLASAMAGNGISASAGQLSAAPLSTGCLKISAQELAVKIADTSLSSDANGLKVGLHTNGSIAIKGADGLASAVPQTSDIGLSPAAVSTDDTDTTLAITSTPAADSLVRVLVNGVAVELGDGVKTKDCYFTGDAGTNARALTAIAASDELYWNGASSFALEVDDIIDIVYAAI